VFFVYHQQLGAHSLYSNVSATRLRLKIVRKGITTRVSGILHYCGHHGRPSQLLLSSCLYFFALQNDEACKMAKSDGFSSVVYLRQHFKQFCECSLKDVG